MKEYELAIPVAEIYNIKRDCEIIKKFAKCNAPIILTALIPLTSLFCYETKEYFRRKGAPLQINQSSKYSIKDIRNKTKFFDVRLNQLLNTIRNVDVLQNKEFINYMKYSETACWNIHDNIGIFFDNKHHIISNTHYSYYIFQDLKLIRKKLEQPLDSINSDPRIPPDEIKAFGYDIGCDISQISASVATAGDFVTSDINIKSVKIKSRDFNTNRICSGNDLYKIIKVFLLHALSSINFIIYFLKECIIRDAGWLLRVEYITYHYIIKRLSEMALYINKKSEELNDLNLLELFKRLTAEFDGDSFFNTDFRNCMMHYGLELDGRIIIKEDCFDLAIPLCGLVESIYNISYWDFQKKIEEKLQNISDNITNYLDIDLRI